MANSLSGSRGQPAAMAGGRRRWPAAGEWRPARCRSLTMATNRVDVIRHHRGEKVRNRTRPTGAVISPFDAVLCDLDGVPASPENRWHRTSGAASVHSPCRLAEDVPLYTQ